MIRTSMRDTPECMERRQWNHTSRALSQRQSVVADVCSVEIVSDSFTGKPLVARHAMVYEVRECVFWHFKLIVL